LSCFPSTPSPPKRLILSYALHNMGKKSMNRRNSKRILCKNRPVSRWTHGTWKFPSLSMPREKIWICFHSAPSTSEYQCCQSIDWERKGNQKYSQRKIESV
jgi:hypothetical protein